MFSHSIANCFRTPALNPTLVFPSGAIRHGQEPTTDVYSKSNLGGHPSLPPIQYSSAADSEEDATDCAPPVLEQLSRAIFNYQMIYLHVSIQY